MTDPFTSSDAQTTPVGSRTSCPQCGVQLDSMTTTCGACGAVITGGAMDPERMERVRQRLQQGIGDGYKLGEMLGRGGMGIVFQARELSLDRDVALKVLAFDPILNPEAYVRFEREAKLAARLDHPNIVPIFAVGQGNGIAFYTMRMVRGGSVESLVAGGQPLEVTRALAILGDVAKALDYAHAQGVVHRDIKPANVLLGEAGHAMVADFGIARAFGGDSAGSTSATGTGVVGSPAYMSPEQWRGEKVDGRADQYALGVLAFELLTGSRPFKGDSMQELLRMHLQDDAPDIISVRHDLPPRLTDPIRRALSKLPVERFVNASEFVAALGGAVVPPSPRSATVAAASAATVRTPMPAGAPRPGAAGRSGASRTQGDDATIAAPRTFAAASAAEPDDSPAKRSMVPWLVLLLIAGAGAGVIWKLAPAQPEAPAPVAGPTLTATNDSLVEMEKRFQAQIDETRRIALAAERRADSLAAVNRALGAGAGASGGGARPAAPAEEPHAHLYVFAQGGAAQVVLDGEVQQGNAPAVFQVAPGRHRIGVRGNQEFAPAETTIVLVAEDTQTVVFRTRRVAAGLDSRPAIRGNVPGVSAAPPGAIITEQAPPQGATGTLLMRNPQTGQMAVNWPEATRKLGFDPRTVDQRRLTPVQRANLRRFQQMLDSARRAAGQKP